MRWYSPACFAVATVALSACGEELSPAERERQEERAIAMVEQANRGAVIAVVPQPILFPDIERHEIYGMSCAFVPENGGLGAVAIAMNNEGYMKLNDSVIRFAADSGSAELPYGARSQYTGKSHSFKISISGEGTPSGAESMNYDGQLNVNDENGAVVYDSGGEVQCGS